MVGLILAGRVWAVISGPPCETFSRARGRPSLGKKLFPRVIRSPECPWGMPTGTGPECDLLDQDNEILRTTVRCAVASTAVGAKFVFLFPEAPGGAHLA
eukprot:6055125-Pyramimonas_sp.AAC.1